MRDNFDRLPHAPHLAPADVERMRQRWARVHATQQMRWEQDEADDVTGSAFVTLVSVGLIVGGIALVGFAWVLGAVWG